MSETDVNDALTLADLRDRIDAVDARMHNLLIERAAVIDALIEAKGTSNSGAAFRPGREAEMMRRLVARHEGALPFATIEHIWREIITTFTRMQAPFDVAIDVSADPERMRDLARFYFGFSVDLVSLPDAVTVVERVVQTGDLGLVARNGSKKNGAWWKGLANQSAPQIMALLPHVAIAGRPADFPAYVISPRLADPTPPGIRIFALSVKGNFSLPGESVTLEGVSEAGRFEVLLAVPASRDAADISLAASGRIESIAEVGSAACGIAVDGEQSLLYQRPD